VVAAARRSLGPVGAFLPIGGGDVADVQRDAARRLEAAGYPAAWTNEVIGKDALVHLAVVLAATDRLILGTSIANVWARPPQTAASAAAALVDAYPGRLVLGLGVGYPQQADAVGRDFGRPLTTMREYVRAMRATTPVGYPLVLAANGPKMLALAAEIADGALPASPAAAATADARAALGPDGLLVVYVGTGAGDPRQVRALIDEHLSAGADHVIAGVAYGTTLPVGLARMEQLAPFVLGER
jgi:probable F420-dependent oxidoreductase